MNKIIFLPSDIYATHNPPPNAALRFAKFAKPGGGHYFEYYSSGLLEDALDSGHAVWVLAEERHLELDFHEWWQALLTQENYLKVPDLTSVDNYGTLEILRSFALDNAPSINHSALHEANTWMRILDLLSAAGFSRVSRRAT
jgi:hypothetical protein